MELTTTKEIRVEAFNYNGLSKRIIKVLVPDDISFKFLNHEDYKSVTKEYKYNKNCIAEEMLYSQQYSEHCNGYAKYYRLKFDKMILNHTNKEYRFLTISEQWQLGAKID